MKYDNFYWMFLQGLLEEHLSTGTLDILFLKKDKSKREMRCTRNPELIPKVEGKAKAGSDLPPQSVPQALGNIPVYDLDAEGWRSFNMTDLYVVEGASIIDWVAEEINTRFHRKPIHIVESAGD